MNQARTSERSNPVLSERPGAVTTIWRDGEIYRTDPWGRTKRLRPIAPVPDPHFAATRKEAIR
jgi:hypothetical protein